MSNIFPFRFSLNLCNAPPLQFERGKEEGDQGESSRHTLDQLQNANSPISGSLFDRFNRLHTLVPSSLRTERKERQKSVISLSLSPSLPPCPPPHPGATRFPLIVSQNCRFVLRYIAFPPPLFVQFAFREQGNGSLLSRSLRPRNVNSKQATPSLESEERHGSLKPSQRGILFRRSTS